MNRHCCVANTHAVDLKTLNAHAQITKTNLNPGLDKPGQEKNYKMCERRAELKQDDSEYMIFLYFVHFNVFFQTF
jgi:hypothetical protein